MVTIGLDPLCTKSDISIFSTFNDLEVVLKILRNIIITISQLRRLPILLLQSCS